MARRVTPAQFQAEVRRAQQRQRAAVNKYNQAVNQYNQEARRHNTGVRKAVNDYNREVRAHNQRVRTNRERLRRELSKLQTAQRRQSTTTTHVTYRRSVSTLVDRWNVIDVEDGRVTDPGLIDLAERETANSVAVLNELDSDSGATTARLNETSITTELDELGGDLGQRWRGALFSLHAANPDAARHFCTSAREVITAVLAGGVLDDEIAAVFPEAARTEQGRITRRERIRFFLHRRGETDASLIDFVDSDVDNVIDLFGTFNDGTHGQAGRFTMLQLAALKTRVEDAILFLHRIIA
jgi:hypothetical protein